MGFFQTFLATAMGFVAVMTTMPAHAESDNSAVAFAKTAYESMIAIDANDPARAGKALANFKANFDFDAFGARCLTDLSAKMTPEEFISIKSLFSDVFFANFEKNTDSLIKRRIAKPTYVVKTATDAHTVVHIAGATAEGNVTFGFHVGKNPAGQWRMIDLEVDSVLLSRNWRGSFNKVFREKGYAGLTAKLKTRLNELRGMAKSS